MDDVVVLARDQTDRLTWIEDQVEGRFRLTINRKKTPSLTGTSLDFLSFTFRDGRNRRDLNVVFSKKAVAKAQDRLRELTGPRRCFMPVTDRATDVSRWLHSWANDFRHGNPHAAFRKLNGFALQPLTRHLNRRSQRDLRPPTGQTFYAHLQTLGLRFR